jgi:hypothetical protein
MAAYAATGCPEDSHIMTLQTTFIPIKQDIFMPVRVVRQSLDHFSDFFIQLREHAFIVFCEANPGYLGIVRITNLPGTVQWQKSLAGFLQLEVPIENHLRPGPPGIEQVFFYKLTHPYIRYRKRQCEDEKHCGTKGDLNLLRQRQRPEPQNFQEPLPNVPYIYTHKFRTCCHLLLLLFYFLLDYM